MAGSAVSPTSLVELTISCRNLLDKDVLSKSDPMCVIFYQPFGTDNWAELKRTECIMNTLNPDFSTKIPITYHFEEQQKLKFQLYDIDSKSPVLSRHDFLGEIQTTLGQLVGAGVTRKPLTDGGQGIITIVAEELTSCKEEICLQFSGRKLENTSFFGSLSTFLEISKVNENNTYTLAHRTECAPGTNPVWKEFAVSMQRICNGDYDRNLRVELKKFKSSGDHKLIGQFDTTVRKLTSGPGKNNVYWVVDEQKKKRKGKSYSNSGEVIANKGMVQQIYSFINYLQGGTELCAFIGIDFTASNGNPTQPDSLHYINSNQPNQYTRAIQAVGEIVEDYDTDKFFPVLGFGARMPPDFTRVSHEFFVNLDPANPFCYRVQGVLEAYNKCIRMVQLYGPTNFAPIVNHVAKFACSNQSGEQYFILLILTDGIISDMAQTKEAIVNASILPLSIIIVGVGNADFDAMDELDGDTVHLSSQGRYAARDIVQFVPFRKFLQGGGDPRTARIRLAREVLAEVPDQFLGYMKANGIVPKPPRADLGSLPNDPTLLGV